MADIPRRTLGPHRGGRLLHDGSGRPQGLVTYYTLFVIKVGSRRVHLAGSSPQPDEAFMRQVARTLTDANDGTLLGHRVLICDRDTKWSLAFRRLLADAGIRVVQTPYRAPNCNAHAERFVRSIKEECLDRVVLFGKAWLPRTLGEFVDHYHRERNHQGIENQLIEPGPLESSGAEIRSPKRLGGLLRYYHRAA